MTDYNLTLSTTEANSVGVVKLRHADTNSQILKVQVIENGLKKSFKGLTPFFCLMAREVTGQGVSEELVTVFDSEKGTLEYTSSDNALQMIGRNEAYFSFRKQSGDTWIEQFSTRSFHYIVEKSIYSQPFKDSNYWWTFKELYEKFISYQESGKEAWEKFVEENREILESIDPGGKILTEIIDARGGKDSLLDHFKTVEQSVYRSNLQRKLWANFQKQMFVDKKVSIECYGDSITYGFTDIKVDPTAKIDERPCDDGTKHDKTQATNNYPKVLQDHLQRIGFDATVYNCGREGAFSSNIMKRFYNDRKTQLTIIMLGMNDSIDGDSNVSIEAYSNNILELIDRQHARGSAVMLMTPTPFRSITLDTQHSGIEDYVRAVQHIAESIGAPVVNLWEEMDNLSAWSHGVVGFTDNIHPSPSGYEFIAMKALARILQRGTQVKVGDGDKLGITKYQDGYIPSPSSQPVGYANRPSSPMTDVDNFDNGEYLGFSVGADLPNTFGYWVFETTEDSTWIFPNYGINSDAKFLLNLELDLGVSAPDGSVLQKPSDLRNYFYGNDTEYKDVRKSIKPIVNYDKNDFTMLANGAVTFPKVFNYRDIIINPKGLYIAKKGLHIIKVTGQQALFYGMDVVSNNSLNSIVKSNARSLYTLRVGDLGLDATKPIKLKPIIELMKKNGLSEITFKIFRSEVWAGIKNYPSTTNAFDTIVNIQAEVNRYASDNNAGFGIKIELNSKFLRGAIYSGTFFENPASNGLQEPLNYEFDYNDFK